MCLAPSSRRRELERKDNPEDEATLVEVSCCKGADFVLIRAMVWVTVVQRREELEINDILQVPFFRKRGANLLQECSGRERSWTF